MSGLIDTLGTAKRSGLLMGALRVSQCVILSVMAHVCEEMKQAVVDDTLTNYCRCSLKIRRGKVRSFRT